MRISKFLSAVCAAAVLTGSLAVRAQDTPAQAAARAALMQKMSELDAQQIQPTNSNPLASVVIPPSAGQEQAVQPAIAAPATPPPVVPVPAAPEAAPVVNPPPPVIVVTPSGAAPVAPADSSGLFTPVPPPSNPEGAQAGTQPRLPNPNSQPAVKPNPPSKLVKPPAKPVKPPAKLVKPPVKSVKPPAAPVVNPLPPANESYAGKTLGLKPIDAPPPPVSAQKEAELQALLAKYMADQVTPEEYQKARAAILAEP